MTHDDGLRSGDTLDAGTGALIAPPQPAPLPTAYRRYALSVLFLIFTFNFLDRQIVNILAEPIKHELALADWQLGALSGLSFAIFYVALALPIARYAERADRVKIIAASVVVWSAFTALCGLATNFVQLLLARIGVGVGEAGCTPTSQSLITDYAPREKRASALAFLSLGIPVGTLMGLAIGGLLADAYGWRAAFLAAGVPGLLLGVLAVLTLPEPRRGAAGKIERANTPTLAQAVHELRSKRAFWWISIGTSLTAFVGFGQQAFYSSFFLRAHDTGLEALALRFGDATGMHLGATAFIGIILGLLLGIFGAIGTLLGGSLADRSAGRDARAYAFIPAIAAVAGIPFFVAAMLATSTPFALLLLAVPITCGTLWYGPVFAGVQSLVRPRTRATAAAVLLFFTNLVGLGFGPLTVGALSDGLAGFGGESIRWALIAAVNVGLLSCGAYLLATRTLREEIVG